MSFQIISDVHLEHLDSEFPGLRAYIIPSADNLIIAGDLGVLGSNAYMQFVKEASCEFREVVIILGNHEFYSNDFDGVQHYFVGMNSMFSNVHFLNNSCVEIEGVVVIGTVLWSHVPDESRHKIETGMNDYTYIRKGNEPLRVRHTNEAFKNNVVFLYDSIIRAMAKKLPVVVVTHHLPCMEAISEQYKYSELNPAFVTDLSHIVRCGAVSAWVHGHSHDFMDVTVGECRVVRNPVGYKGRLAPTVVVRCPK